MLARLAGLETEYAIRFSTTAGSPRPDGEQIYAALAQEIRTLVRTRPASGFGAEKFFTENGGAFSREGEDLIEGNTPECRGPSQVLLYQRAQDELLIRALAGATARLAVRGFPGELGLIKNCRDARGNVYGAQENYELNLAGGSLLWVYRLGLLLVLPLALVAVVLSWVAIAAVFGTALAMIPLALLALSVPSLRRGWERLERNERLKRALGRFLLEALTSPWWPVLAMHAAVLRAFAFRRVRRAILGFLVSRPILSGTGTLGESGAFGLSEKGLSVSRAFPVIPRRGGVAVFDVGNLLKALLEGGLYLQPRRILQLFARRQRMQLGLSDSNAAQVAEYLKVAITMLVIDMAEDGYLDDAPRFSDSVDALHRFIADPSLRVAVPLQGGASVRALDVQRFYLDRAGQYLREAPTTPLPAAEIVRLWGEALDALEENPERLVGRLDWVTKKYLLDTVGSQLSPASRKKIDLKYHELGAGYLARLTTAGQAPELVPGPEVERAIREPPEDTPAFARGRLVRRLADSAAPAAVSWGSVRAGGWLGGKVIRLADFRALEADEKPVSLPAAPGSVSVLLGRPSSHPDTPAWVSSPSERRPADAEDEQPDFPALVSTILAPWVGSRVHLGGVPGKKEANVRKHVLGGGHRQDPLVAVIDLTYLGSARDAVALTPTHLFAAEGETRVRFALADLESVRPQLSFLEVGLRDGRTRKVPTGPREEVVLELLTRIAMGR